MAMGKCDTAHSLKDLEEAAPSRQRRLQVERTCIVHELLRTGPGRAGAVIGRLGMTLIGASHEVEDVQTRAVFKRMALHADELI